MKKLVISAFLLGASMFVANSAFAYEVKPGDTMSEIARSNNITLEELVKTNSSIKNIDLIFIGQKINLPGEKLTNESSLEYVAKKDKTNKSVKPTNDYIELTVEATAYTAYCEGCSGVTYTGIDLRSNPNSKVIAVDPSIIPLGSTVEVEGYGTAIAGDIGGAIKGNRIDLFVPDLTEALKFGRQTIKIKVLK